MDFAERIEDTRATRSAPRAAPDKESSPAGMLRLQRLAGNAAVTQAIQTGFSPVQRQDEELEEDEMQAEQQLASAEEQMASVEEEELEEEEEMV